MATSWTQDDLTNIEKAIAKGVLTVHFKDRSVTYRSVNELLVARDAIQGELNAGLPQKPRRVVVGTESGWGHGRWPGDCH